MKITFEQIFPLLLRYLGKGFIVFLVFGLIIVIMDSLGITCYMDHIYPKVQQLGMIGKFVALVIFGMIVQHTFWK